MLGAGVASQQLCWAAAGYTLERTGNRCPASFRFAPSAELRPGRKQLAS